MIREHLDATPGMTQEELADWAVYKFKLSKAPSRSTICRALQPPLAIVQRPSAKTTVRVQVSKRK